MACKATATRKEALRLKFNALLNHLKDETRDFIDPTPPKWDGEILQLLTELIEYARTLSTEEANLRVKALYNISAATTWLSNRNPANGYPHFKERFLAEERSIWRELEFMLKFTFPREIKGGYFALGKNYQIHPEVLDRIFAQDLANLEELANNAATIINDNPTSHHEQLDSLAITYRGQEESTLPTIYRLVNYYRTYESIAKILKYTDPDKVIGNIDITTPKGKLALYKVLEVVGEACTKKNLAPHIREKLINEGVDLGLLVKARNNLSHPEWEWHLERPITYKYMSNKIDRSLHNILEHTIPYIRAKFLILERGFTELVAASSGKMEYKLQEPVSWERTLTEYFPSTKPIWRIKDSNKARILEQLPEEIEHTQRSQVEELLSQAFFSLEELKNIGSQIKTLTGLSNRELGMINILLGKEYTKARKQKTKPKSTGAHGCFGYLNDLLSILPPENGSPSYLTRLKKYPTGTEQTKLVNDTLVLLKLLEDLCESNSLNEVLALNRDFLAAPQPSFFNPDPEVYDKIMQFRYSPSYKHFTALYKDYASFALQMHYKDDYKLVRQSSYYKEYIEALATIGFCTETEGIPLILSEPDYSYVYTSRGRIPVISPSPIEQDMEDTILYAKFLVIAGKLKKDTFLSWGVKLLLAQIYGNLDAIECTNLKHYKQELKVHRNIIKHGHVIYFDILSEECESQYLARYMSIYLVGVKNCLEEHLAELSASLSSASLPDTVTRSRASTMSWESRVTASLSKSEYKSVS